MCAELVEATRLTSCDELKACLDGAIAAGTLPTFNQTRAADGDEAAAGESAGLAVYFALLYFLYYACGWTSTKIPYDALGMELTPVRHVTRLSPLSPWVM